MRIKKKKRFADDSKKEKYMKYGTIYGKKYCVKTDYGVGQRVHDGNAGKVYLRIL
jgi:hypothetical protein